MNLLSVIVLGIVQGIAEFLPISSSAHLIIFRDIFGIGSFMKGNMELTFDIALHLGTLLAIFLYFYKDFINMVKDGFTKNDRKKKNNLLWYILAATVPAGVAGVLFEDKIESIIRNNYVVIALALIFMGIVIYLCDKKSEEKKEIKDITLRDAIIIGCSQVFALIPGFSRSGTTISASRLLKIKREDAAKFSFFLSAPVVGGAVLLKLVKKSTWTLIFSNLNIFLIGIFASFITGLFCIKFLLKYLNKHDFKVFMIYRIIIAIIVLLVISLK